ncbi:DNA excision repair protein ERCC-6 [Schistosoma japonicum]|nr:DNA excision repair protein ERCC-6 [Schistosoma japonicum]KAH8869611.1 DNA excision repair protein ERCC-6 [Schistosoma japonicum]
MKNLDPCCNPSTSKSKSCVNNPARFLINKEIMKKADNQDVNSIHRVVAFDQLEFEASMFLLGYFILI